MGYLNLWDTFVYSTFCFWQPW